MKNIVKLLKNKILFLDGAMGTMIQKQKLNEADFKGKRFKNWKKLLKGNNDILNIIGWRLPQNIIRSFSQLKLYEFKKIK